MTEFEIELRHILNKYSIENETDTPDFILARYLNECLTVFSNLMKRRSEWYMGNTPEGSQ